MKYYTDHTSSLVGSTTPGTDHKPGVEYSAPAALSQPPPDTVHLAAGAGKGWCRIFGTMATRLGVVIT